MNNHKSTIINQKSELYAIGSTILQANYLDELIEQFQGDPEEQEFVQYCRFMKRIKLKLEYAEANMNLREQCKAAQKEHPTQDDSPNINQGELINSEPEAAKASGF